MIWNFVMAVSAAAIAAKSLSSFFWKRLYSSNFACPILYLNLRRICVGTTVENEREKLTPKEEEEKIRKREAGKQLHAVYHHKVNEIAKEFRVNRLEWEKNLTNENHKKGELRLLEKEIHDRVIESAKLENERIQKLREERIEREILSNEEYNKEKKKTRKHFEERQRQERIELVRKTIEESENWVTSENLEEKITYCLEHETNYNFALSPTGEKHYSTSPPGCIDTVENAPGPAAQYPTGLPSRSAN